MRRMNQSEPFSDCVGPFYRASRGLEDADWLMLPACLIAACALANSD